MTLKTRTKFTSQLQGIQEHVVRLKEKCAADVRAAGLAATGDRGAQEGVVEGRKALIIDFIRTPPTFIRTCADECGNPIP